jgi:putative PIN family toxin of toxin-antitoxin system
VRVVLDTNLVLSAFLWGGTPYRLLEAARAGVIHLVTSLALVNEFRKVLSRVQFARVIQAGGKSVDQLVAEYENRCIVLDPPPLPATVVTADPDDDAVLACAVAANANVIVSGDRHLLALGSYQGIPIFTAAALLARLTPPAPPGSAGPTP